MIKRNSLVKVHLYASGFFAPFLLIMAITGTFYLLDIKGSEERVFVKELLLENKPDEVIVKNVLAKVEPGYDFAYLKSAGTRVFTRPTTRAYYSFEKENDIYKLYKIRPNILRTLIEVHKGHGPKSMRIFEILLGIALLTILITGVWIGIMTARDKKVTLITMGAGAASFLIILLFL